MSRVKYPQVVVDAPGDTDDALSIIGEVSSALRDAGVAESEIDKFRREAISVDYEDLRSVVMGWVTVS